MGFFYVFIWIIAKVFVSCKYISKQLKIKTMKISKQLYEMAHSIAALEDKLESTEAALIEQQRINETSKDVLQFAAKQLGLTIDELYEAMSTINTQPFQSPSSHIEEMQELEAEDSLTPEQKYAYYYDLSIKFDHYIK